GARQTLGRSHITRRNGGHLAARPWSRRRPAEGGTPPALSTRDWPTKGGVPFAGWRLSVKVLIVDDEEELRAILSESLRAKGVQTFEARNGLECLLHVKHEHPEVIVLDL